MMCFFSHILIVRLYSAVAHHGLFLREKLVLYPKVEVVAVLLPQEFEEFDGQHEGACLAVEHRRAPRLAAEHAANRHAGRLRELEKSILAAILRERNKFSQGEAVLDCDLGKT